MWGEGGDFWGGGGCGGEVVDEGLEEKEEMKEDFLEKGERVKRFWSVDEIWERLFGCWGRSFEWKYWG